jgi:tRNA1Val (adenine37-N6)-methyltransferase
MPDSLGTDETLDILCNEKVRVIQKKDGYRLSMDPLLLANFIHLKRHETLLDVGTGCGIIPIYMAKRGCTNRLVGLEIQDELYDLAVRNKDLNGCANVEFFKGDVRNSAKGLGAFHAVASNPPYVKERTGRRSPGPSRLIARHESELDLAALLSVASSLLATRGRLYLIYPAKRLGELMYESKSRHLEPKRLKMVHSRAGEQAKLLLLECLKGGGVGLKVEPPLYIYADGDYTEEVKAYYA